VLKIAAPGNKVATVPRSTPNLDTLANKITDSNVRNSKFPTPLREGYTIATEILNKAVLNNDIFDISALTVEKNSVTLFWSFPFNIYEFCIAPIKM